MIPWPGYEYKKRKKHESKFDDFGLSPPPSFCGHTTTAMHDVEYTHTPGTQKIFRKYFESTGAWRGPRRSVGHVVQYIEHCFVFLVLLFGRFLSEKRRNARVGQGPSCLSSVTRGALNVQLQLASHPKYRLCKDVRSRHPTKRSHCATSDDKKHKCATAVDNKYTTSL